MNEIDQARCNGENQSDCYEPRRPFCPENVVLDRLNNVEDQCTDKETIRDRIEQVEDCGVQLGPVAWTD
jgi:hypothetical protein